MKIEIKNFAIETNKDLDYIDEVIKTLEDRTIPILEFFQLEKLKNVKRVIIYTDKEEYKEHLLPYEGVYYDWMCADTDDGNINLLDINEARKTKEHQNMDLEEFIKIILHEFVHSCQQEINPNSDGVEWFWESLATNLSGQDFEETSLDDCDYVSLERNFNKTPNGYDYSYTIGRYMLDNYSHEELLEYIKYPDLLKKDAHNIFTSAKKSFNKKH